MGRGRSALVNLRDLAFFKDSRGFCDAAVLTCVRTLAKVRQTTGGCDV
jgi:hypothetical protein